MGDGKSRDCRRPPVYIRTTYNWDNRTRIIYRRPPTTNTTTTATTTKALLRSIVIEFAAAWGKMSERGCLSVFSNEYLLRKIVEYLKEEEFEQGLMLSCIIIYKVGQKIIPTIPLMVDIMVLQQSKAIVFRWDEAETRVRSRTYVTTDDNGMDKRVRRYTVKLLILDRYAVLSRTSGINMCHVSMILVARLSQVLAWPIGVSAVLIARSNEMMTFDWRNV